MKITEKSSQIAHKKVEVFTLTYSLMFDEKTATFNF